MLLALRPNPRRAASRRFLALTVALPWLAACGQKGDLFIPSGTAAAQRATLPQTLAPSTSVSTPTLPASAPPVTGTASPVRQP